jgi:hypothetical protein
MRIYIHNLPQIKLSKLQKYLINEKTYTQLYSCEGIFNVESSNIYRCESPSCHNTETIQYKSATLLVDKSDYKTEKVVSQLPVDYIGIKTTQCKYSIDKKSQLKLVVLKSEQNDMPLQVYFEIDNLDLDDFFVTNDLDEFLMCFYS